MEQWTPELRWMDIGLYEDKRESYIKHGWKCVCTLSPNHVSVEPEFQGFSSICKARKPQKSLTDTWFLLLKSKYIPRTLTRLNPPNIGFCLCLTLSPSCCYHLTQTSGSEIELFAFTDAWFKTLVDIGPNSCEFGFSWHFKRRWTDFFAIFCRLLTISSMLENALILFKLLVNIGLILKHFYHQTDHHSHELFYCIA